MRISCCNSSGQSVSEAAAWSERRYGQGTNLYWVNGQDHVVHFFRDRRANSMLNIISRANILEFYLKHKIDGLPSLTPVDATTHNARS